jgi:hypothetical protein
MNQIQMLGMKLILKTIQFEVIKRNNIHMQRNSMFKKKKKL